MVRDSYPKFFLQSDGRENHEEQSRDEESSRSVARLGELNTVEQAIFDGWRYLGLDSAKILSLTPREFTIMMAANVERTYRSEEHTSELQSRGHLVCRLLLEKKKKN